MSILRQVFSRDSITTVLLPCGLPPVQIAFRPRGDDRWINVLVEKNLIEKNLSRADPTTILNGATAPLIISRSGMFAF